MEILDQAPHASYVLVCGYHPQTREYVGPVPAWRSPLEGCYPLPAHSVDIEPPGPAAPKNSWRLNAAGDAWEGVPDYRMIPLYSTETGQPLPPLAFGAAPPQDSTSQLPPWPGERQARKWDANSQRWLLRADWRGMPLWRKADAMPVWAELGETPAELQATDQRPPADFPIWMGDHWEIDEDAKAKAETEASKPTEAVRAAKIRSERDRRLALTEWLAQRHRDEIDLGQPTTLSRDEFDALLTYRQALRDVSSQQGFPDDVNWPVAPDLQ
ncbi:phage tail assembly chaperone [Chromobacterium piscinae]|uniref:phage tail assembly chaperone n=1 Tax=Chromobacterium piscinae TaxID=686831 RepID=UPI001E38CDF4|nr:phage tail assembly chaperone [Chromobacterium piscinae]MCD4505517.1 phage tail assembly chaperone [Chromobacterium piscinae]